MNAPVPARISLAALIIKPAGDGCNLRCGYCFYHGQPQHIELMEPDLLERIIREYLALSPRYARFIWHGGEPLLAGLDYFERIITWQRACVQPGQRIVNQLQTNGTLIDAAWASFFKRESFGVGLSLDGASASHDRYRRDAQGQGSHRAAVRGLELLRAHGVRAGVIQVVTRDALGNCAADFEYFAHGLHLNRWAVSQCYAPDGAGHVNAAEWTAYLLGLAGLWLACDRPEVRVRELTNLLAGATGKRPRLCQFNGQCARYACIEADGRVYPCDRFSGQAEYLLGDVSRQPLAEVLGGTTRRRWAVKVAQAPARCHACGFKNVCHNGCAQQRAGGPDGLYDYCESRLALYAFLQEQVAQHHPR